ncbi:MAG: TetR/AcrR family transcriptional regulator [Acidimicrobiales bacterium]
MPRSPSLPRASRATEDNVRGRLLDAADELLRTEGPDGLTVRAMAERAGCSTMGVYTHFGGKDGVVDALYVEGFRRLADAISRVRTTADPVADLRRCGLAYRRNALSNPTHYLVMFERIVPGFEPSPEAKAAGVGTLALLEARISRGVELGQVIDRPDPAELALSLWASLHGMVSLELHDAGPPTDRRRSYDDLLDLLLRALAA